jgi:hypothetical protein
MIVLYLKSFILISLLYESANNDSALTGLFQQRKIVQVRISEEGAENF